MTTDARTQLAKFALIVEDDTDLGRVLKEALKGEGIEARLALSASEALEILRADWNRMSFILSDVQMPGLSGVELLKEVRRSACKAVPFIAMSGNLNLQTQTDLADAGVDACIAKPFLFSDLIQTLARAGAPVADTKGAKTSGPR